MSRPQITINRHGQDRIEQGHPWVFKSDITHVQNTSTGAIVDITTPKGRFLGRGYFNPASQITVRLLTRRKEEVDRDFFRTRLCKAIARRNPAAPSTRLVFGEADFLPGLIIDRYGDAIVLQTLTLGMDRLKETWIELIEEQLHPKAIIERNDVAVREKEGLLLQKGILKGNLPDNLVVNQNGYSFRVDPLEGQKTGLYLDQEENHLAANRYARGRVLDLFCYQGGFSIHSASQADEIIAVDSSESSLKILGENLALNQIQNVHTLGANVFDYLRSCQNQGEPFDMILLDPPPFVSSRKAIQSATRGYKEINLRAMKLLKPGGILVTCSCSQNFTQDMFYEMLLSASRIGLSTVLDCQGYLVLPMPLKL
ncbi:MAG: class I SAM-dependent rRNA methyltransferase [Deltaproteobacteria bacterium]|nr:class I SAM-dependent rRNA methyltransferase [Deltaproteobacteria bacterium]